MSEQVRRPATVHLSKGGTVSDTSVVSTDSGVRVFDGEIESFFPWHAVAFIIYQD